MAKKWSQKYKRSIDCNNPKGFSQKAHCAGRKKQESMMNLKSLVKEMMERFKILENFGVKNISTFNCLCSLLCCAPKVWSF